MVRSLLSIDPLPSTAMSTSDHTTSSGQPDADKPWRALKLSLERPYKDDSGKPMQTLLDIGPDGSFIYEPKEDWNAKLGQNFRRIFAERGIDFFETFDAKLNARDVTSGEHAQSEEELDDGEGETKFMSPEQLFKMRSEILPRLHIAYGEMSHARDLLSLLLAKAPTYETATSTPHSLPAKAIASSSVSKLPDIPSLEAFNVRLVTGGKDDALRKASDVLHQAAVRMERSAAKADKFWSDALSLRKANWSMIPAPLPLGSATAGKAGDKTSKDFFISFGLSQSPALFRRRAIAHMPYYNTKQDTSPVTFPHRIQARLHVSLTTINADTGLSVTSRGAIDHLDVVEGDPDDTVRQAQREVIDQEIFETLIKEAGDLPTASARVSERLIVVDAVPGVELRFEMIDFDSRSSSRSNDEDGGSSGQAICSLIYSLLHVLLLRVHSHTKAVRLGNGQSPVSSILQGGHASRFPASSIPPAVLRPIIDVLQYHVFCSRIESELHKGVLALRRIGVPVSLRFNSTGENGQQVIKAIVNDVKGRLEGEAVLRIDDRHSMRFTFQAPSTLAAHLPQATSISVISGPQLIQLLVDEFERSLLGRLCNIGSEVCGEGINATWFVDDMMCRCVGRWEGCVLTFRVQCLDGLASGLDCHAQRIISNDKNRFPETWSFSKRDDRDQGLFAWVRHIVESTLNVQ